ncbi:lysozyme inhibitor LprI family protein [Luteolibacter flavescens]|uniref:Lysozyme inhibitor LprI family protein n=1 Tax=Luteolibacter flavescens TaxID=1859460 RepID=A0ABT3FKR2_9BACT|nr:lysozyme inhibitor LprI family protein [Luteolibacter flavescens]MCW1884146.1 lysozyme inhibitor LprI family protein [Luteolibacter flavescens]
MRLFSLCLLLIIAAPAALRAQSQQEMNAEAAESFRKADKELNEVYVKVVANLDDQAKENLKKSQRAWVAWRDAEAAFRADAEARGGSMWPLVHEGVRSRLTKERVKGLKELLLKEK